MKPLYITVGDKLPVMVIPDAQAHVDGHPVLTYTYSIFRNKNITEDNNLVEVRNHTEIEKTHDPNYMGFITFEQPGKLFNYTADGKAKLSPREVEEIIEEISQYRDTPSQWQI